MDLKEIDEVWLGLDIANTYLISTGHHPQKKSFNGDGCSGCDSLWYIRNAMEAYKKRANNSVPEV